MGKQHSDNSSRSHPPQVEPDWCRDWPSLTVILAAAFDAKTMKKLFSRAGYERCLCHTGAVASGCRRLRQVVRLADLVIFITTVNSHTAINAVKEECKKRGKPFYALGRTGAGSLEKALMGMAAYFFWIYCSSCLTYGGPYDAF